MMAPSGLYGVIEHGAGSQDIHPWEGIQIEPQGVYIHHNNKFDTVTFLPIFTVRMVRYHKNDGHSGPDVSGKEWTKQHTQKGLPSGERTDTDDQVGIEGSPSA